MGRSPRKGMWHAFFPFSLSQETELELKQIHPYWTVCKRQDSGLWVSLSMRILPDAKAVSRRTHVCVIGCIPVRVTSPTLGRSQELLGGTGASLLDKDVSQD